MLLHAGRANEASSGVDELKALDVTVTGLQLERTIERGQALVADTRARYESSSQSEPTMQKVVKKKKARTPRNICFPCRNVKPAACHPGDGHQTPNTQACVAPMYGCSHAVTPLAAAGCVPPF